MIFRRRHHHGMSSADTRSAISRFWTWWADNRDSVVVAAHEGRLDAVRTLIDPAVDALDPALEWEMPAGADKPFALVVSGRGDVALRAMTERWVHEQPEDPDVEFVPARQPDPEGSGPRVATADGFELDLSELVAAAGVNPKRGVMDVVVHHPLFPLLGPDGREHVAYEGLSAAIGEDEIGRWVGSVSVTPDEPVDTLTLPMLPAVVDQLRPPGSGWVTLRGEGRKGPITAEVRRPLLRVERPLADTHLAVIMRYRAQADGLPRDEAVDADSQRLLARVLEALGGTCSHVVYVGRVTGERHVVGHFYVDGLEVDISPVDPVVKQWSHGVATKRHALDVDWSAVAALRV